MYSKQKKTFFKITQNGWHLCSSVYVQVCIVQKRDTGRLFAMKYVSRTACDSRDALSGVLKEVELLSSLEHPFLVNLWFSFQGNVCEIYYLNTNKKRVKYLTTSVVTVFDLAAASQTRKIYSWFPTC